jgi:hypothetical protein
MNYEEFSVTFGVGGKRYDCRFYTLITGISPRHSDSVDVKFLVNGKGAVVALPHAGFAEYKQRAGRPLTDGEAIQIAGLFLKECLQKEGLDEDRMLVPSTQQLLTLAEAIDSVVSGQQSEPRP